MTASTSSITHQKILDQIYPIKKKYQAETFSFTIVPSGHQWSVNVKTDALPLQIQAIDLAPNFGLSGALNAYHLLRKIVVTSIMNAQIQIDIAVNDHRDLARWLYVLPSNHKMIDELCTKANKWVTEMLDRKDGREASEEELESLLDFACCPFAKVAQTASRVLFYQKGEYAVALQQVVLDSKYDNYLLLASFRNRQWQPTDQDAFTEFRRLALLSGPDNESPRPLDFMALLVLEGLALASGSFSRDARELVEHIAQSTHLSSYAKSILQRLRSQFTQSTQLEHQRCGQVITKSLREQEDLKDRDRHLRRLSEILKQAYRTRPIATIERVLDKTPFPIGECFIRLAVVLDQEQRTPEQGLDSPSENYYNTFECIYKPKKSVLLHDLFGSSDETAKLSRVLVEGRAGIGKSTFCKYIVNRWAELDPVERQKCLGGWSNRFELLIHLPLREVVRDLVSKSLPEIIRELYFSGDDGPNLEEINKTLSDCEKRGKVLYLLDGYDEVESLLTVSSIEKWFQNTFTQKKHWLLTSRPGFYEEEVPRHLEILGFDEEDIPHFIDNYFSRYPAKAIALKEQIEMYQTLAGIAHVPILLEFLCHIWGQNLKGEKLAISTAAVYEQMISHMFRRSCEDSEKKIMGLTPREVLQEPRHKKMLAFLGALAWKGILEETLIFKPEHYCEIISNYRKPEDASLFAEQVFQRLGMLKDRSRYDDTRSVYLVDREYYFLHLSLQEYLAAHHLAEGLRSGADAELCLLDKVKDERRFRVVLYFTAGILCQHQSDAKTLNLFFEKICHNLSSLSSGTPGLKELDLPLLCLEGTQASERVKLKGKIIGTFTSFLRNPFLEEQSFVWRRDLECLPQLQKVLCDDHPKLVQSFEKIYRREGLTTVSYGRGSPFPNPDWFCEHKVYPATFLDLVTKDLESSVEKNLVHGLLWAGSFMSASDSLVKKLVALSDHHSPRIRQEAILALKSTTSNRDLVLRAVCRKLEDPDASVRAVAVGAVGRLKLGDVIAIDALLKKFEDSELSVRQAAASALGKLQITDLKTLLGIVAKLESSEAHVSEAVAWALTEMQVTNPAVLNAIAAKFDHVLPSVREAALRALGGLRTTDKGLIAAIARKLDDPEATVREAAIKALLELRINDPETLSSLSKKLEDTTTSVREAAVRAIGSLKITDPLLIAAVAGRLEDGEINVRKAAVWALKCLCVSNPLILLALVSKLEDRAQSVREASVWALGALAWTDSSINSAIVDKLEHPEREVRDAAKSVLNCKRIFFKAPVEPK